MNYAGEENTDKYLPSRPERDSFRGAQIRLNKKISSRKESDTYVVIGRNRGPIPGVLFTRMTKDYNKLTREAIFLTYYW
jgi:hypothetical protein